MTNNRITYSGQDILLKAVVVYIAEAHADDEWPISSARYNFGKEVHINQTRSTASRAQAAKQFFDDFGYSELVNTSEAPKDSVWSLVASQPEEELGNDFGLSFEVQYKPWPFRAYGFVAKTVDFIAEPRSCEVDIRDITAWIVSHVGDF